MSGRQSADSSTDPRLRKLDELMWTFLRLLGIEESLQRFLETEKRENIPTLLKDAEDEAARLKADVDTLKAAGNTTAVDGRQRYLDSRLERLEVPVIAPRVHRPQTLRRPTTGEPTSAMPIKQRA